ncbi:MAG: rod shape-determining protein RodA [Proteobacteria bacterium]|nr:rod shape-determining protein RodA [Pseudomonadota bacterium]
MEVYRRRTYFKYRNNWQRIHLDPFLLFSLLLLIGAGLTVLYSAANQNISLVLAQVARLGLAFVILLFFAQISPPRLKAWSPWLYVIGILLLVAVLIIGEIGKGAQRWLELGLFRFQPSEIMKLAVPLFLAWYLSDKPLPPTPKTLLVCGAIILVPTLLVAKQPDLGTALVLVIAGGSVLIFAGLSWRLILGCLILIGASTPILWHFLHDYQRQRVLTFLDPERDPLGNGYHIIQSKIAIGSGGIFGKGWLHGTQSHLDFLPEHTTDFIFAVNGEEFGLLGCIIVLIIYFVIFARIMLIAKDAQDTFSRLIASSVALIFFMSLFINIGMVIGILPVVGLPLPLFSYGGTSMVTLMAMFGIVMSIHTCRKLVPT